MKSKFYAVKRGLVPGIYTSWDECRRQVNGYPGAMFKSFFSKEEAEDYLSDGGSSKSINALNLPECAYAFVDGSFNASTGTYGYGGFLVPPVSDGDREPIVLQGCESFGEYAEHRNVAGEVLGAENAICEALIREYKKLVIFYDYEGIRSWADGLWKCNKKLTQEYKAFVCAAREKMEIVYVHVKGHSGIPGNEKADKLAKEAVGI